jgi:hypothetical protein
MTPSCERRRVSTRDLVAMLHHGRLLPAGGPGGPAWDTTRQALLFASLENHWPVGVLLAWSPTGYRNASWYLLDGHRRAATLHLLVGDQADLVRDLEAGEPAYRPLGLAPPGGAYLPVNAMLATLDFLHATRTLPPPTRRHAEQAASHIIRSGWEIWLLPGGSTGEVATLCQRLLPGRVTTATLEHIAASHQTSSP